MLLHSGFALGASRIDFSGTYLSEADQTIYTFADVPLGDPSPERIVFVGVYQEPKTVTTDFVETSSVSVGLEEFGWNFYNDTTTFSLELWLGEYPEGETADIVIEANREIGRCEIAVFSMYNQGFTSTLWGRPTAINDTSFTMPLQEGGGCLVLAPSILTFTGLDHTFAGTYFSGAYHLAAGRNSAFPYSTSAAIGMPTAASFGGLSFAP